MAHNDFIMLDFINSFLTGVFREHLLHSVHYDGRDQRTISGEVYR